MQRTWKQFDPLGFPFKTWQVGPERCLVWGCLSPRRRQYPFEYVLPSAPGLPSLPVWLVVTGSLWMSPVGLWSSLMVLSPAWVVSSHSGVGHAENFRENQPPPTPKSPHLCVAVSSPVLCPANSGHLGLPRPLALSSQLKRTCRALLGVYLPYCGVRQWAGAIVGLALCVFPSLRNCLSFVVWNGFITIVSCILSGFLWAFCLFVYIDSGRRVNLVPVALSWWDTKVLLWFKFFSYPLLKLQQSAGHIDVSFAACFWY